MSSLGSRQIDALDRIQKKPELQQFFFRELKGLKWFDELQKRGFFAASLNPEPKESKEEGFYMIPVWPILTYLEKTAPELHGEGGVEYAKKYVEIMRAVTLSSQKSGISNFRTWWYFSKLLEYIPIDVLSLDDIDMFAYWLKDRFDSMIISDELGNKALPHFLTTNTPHSLRLAEKLIKALIEVQWIEKPWGIKKEKEPVFYFDDYHANKIIQNQSKKMGSILEQRAVEIFKNRINEVLGQYEKLEYSPIWRPAIENHEQNKHRDDALNILITGFRDALCGYIEKKGYLASEVSQYVKELLVSQNNIFQRVALFTIGSYYDVLKSLIPNLLESKYFTSIYRHEIFHLLKKHFSDFEIDQKAKILQIIDSLKDVNEKDEFKEIRIASRKLNWLVAIKNQGYAPADALYSKYISITGKEPEHPDFSHYMEVGWMGEISPYNANELLSMAIDELLDILIQFQEKKGWQTPTKRGLGETLKNAVKTKPDHFRGNLSKFHDVDLTYCYEIIEAHRELWQDKKYDNWSELLNFCEGLINRSGFWDIEPDKTTEAFIANRSWIIGAVGTLIREGTVKDENAFEPELLPKAKKMLIEILDKQEGADFKSDTDAVSLTINSARGKCLEALFNYTLRACRIADKIASTHADTWNEIQPIFDKEVLRVKERNYEFLTLFGMYLSNLLYMNKDWSLQKLDVIFSKKSRLSWLCAMQGYSYVNVVYEEIYNFLKTNEHFIEALDATELKDNVKKRVIQNVVIAYIQEKESLEDSKSIINKIIERWNFNELSELIWFFWTLRHGHTKNIEKSVIKLWEKISDKIVNRENEEKKLLSKLCLWSVFITEISTVSMKLLKQCASYVDVEYNSHVLIEELKRLVEKYPKEVGEIFDDMLERFAPSHEEDQISYIVRYIYKNEASRSLANSIIDKYIKHGYDFLLKIRD